MAATSVPTTYTSEHIPCDEFIQLRGCSLLLGKTTAYLVGGRDAKSSEEAPMFISTHCLDLVSLKWTPVEIDHGGIPNRIGHCSGVIQKDGKESLFIHGGVSMIQPSAPFGLSAIGRVQNDRAGVGIVWSRALATSAVSDNPDQPFLTVDEPELCWASGGIGRKSHGGNYYLVFGGKLSNSENSFNTECYIYDDIGSQDHAIWYKPAMVGNCPSGRIYANGQFAPNGSHFIMAGGFDGTQFQNDLWVVNAEACSMYQASSSTAEAESQDKKGGKKAPALTPVELIWTQIRFEDGVPYNFVAPKITVAASKDGENAILLVHCGANGGMISTTLPRHLVQVKPSSSTEPQDKKKTRRSTAEEGSWSSVAWSTIDLAAAWPASGPQDPLLAAPLLPSPSPVPQPSASIDKGDKGESKEKTQDEDGRGDMPESNPLLNDIAEGEYNCLALDTSGEYSRVWWVNMATVDCPDLSDPKERHQQQVFDVGVSLGWGREENASGDIFEGQMKHGKWNGRGKLSCSNGDIYIGEFNEGCRSGQGEILYKGGKEGCYKGDWAQDVREGTGKMQYGPDAVEDTYEGEFHLDKRHGTGKCLYKNGDVFEGEWFDDCQAGGGSCSYGDDGGIYTGGFLNGLPHGHGELRNREFIYTGNFSNGKQDGEGKCKYSDGRDYIGLWKRGKRNGTGRCSFPFGTYDGKWRADQRCGKGLMQWTSGDRYIGLWDEDCRHGQGCQDYANGDRYEGEFQKDQKHGSGTYFYTEGSTYTGRWEEDQRSGTGEGGFEEGQHPKGFVGNYRGQWYKDLPEGQGVFEFANGDVYEGYFYKGAMHGHGQMRYASNTANYTGEWFEGQRHGKGKLQSFTVQADGETEYDGEWERDMRSGSGRSCYESGLHYEGQWNMDQRNGLGKQVYSNGDVYEGQFSNGVRSGLGTLVYKAGGSYNGEFQNDQPDVPDDHYQSAEHASEAATHFLEKKKRGVLFKKSSGKYKVGVSS